MDKAINFAWPVTTLCKYDYSALCIFVESNKNTLESKKLVIFGAGIRGTAFSLMLEGMGYNNICFTDNNEKKIGGMINQFPIESFSELLKEKEEIIIIISVENGDSIKEQLLEYGFIENSNMFMVDSGLYPKYINEFNREGNINFLVMGDCGLTDISIKDKNFINVEEMVKHGLGEENTKVLAMHGMGMRAFYNVIHAQIKYRSKPKVIAVMANFEVFTGKQHLLPRSQHAKLMELLSRSVMEDDEELKEYAELAKERFDNFRIDYFASSKSVLNSMNKEKNDRIVLKMNYMYKLKEDNECVVYLKRIINLCKSENIHLFFFIPPVNYMYAEQLLGEEFTVKYHENIERLSNIIKAYDVEVLDLSYILDSSQFADINTIDETTNYMGREIFANQLINKLKGY